MQLFEFGKGKNVTGTRYPVLYHLCEYSSFSYAIETNSIRSRSGYVSTTWDETMNHVAGKLHVAFKFVLDGTKIIDQYGAFEYDDHAYEIGSSGSRKAVSHNEREIGIDTRTIEPLTDYLIGTVLLMDLFSETGLQWLLYRNKGQRAGFMTQEITATDRAINTLYRHIFVLKKPVWKYRVGDSFTTQELALLREVYRISKFDWPFTKALEHLAGKFPIRDMWNRSVDRETYARRHMAPKMVALINSYFSNLRVKDVDVSIVKKIIDKCIDMVNLGGNADAIIRHALDQSGLYHQTTEAVTWGGVLRAIMDGDVDEILETIEYFSKRERRTRDDWDHDADDDMKKYRVHVGTSFGRGVSADF